MDADLRRRLDDLSCQLDTMKDRLDEIDRRSKSTYREIFELPMGAKATDKTFYQKVNDATTTIDRLKWLSRLAAWAVPFVAGIAAALKAFWSQIFGGSG